jgi:hypothetical protein
MPVAFLVHDVAVAGPATHALVIGVGAYPHLNGGTGKRTADHDGMEQLTSPPISAREFASWLISDFHHPEKPLASVSFLLSEADPFPFTDPTDAAKIFDVAEATSKNVEDAVKAFFKRGDEDAGNQLIFYFCGHGIGQGTDTALLLSDYGEDEFNALKGAIDFRLLRLGMNRCKATNQIYFVDACRSSTDTLIEAAGNAGGVIIGAGRRPSGLEPRRAPVFYATLNGFKAYAIPGKPTIFTDALLKSLRDLAADDEMGDWRVATGKLQTAVEHVMERAAADIQKRQVPTADEFSNFHLTFIKDVPDALVYVVSNPPDAIEAATLSFQLAGGALTNAPVDGRNSELWTLQLPSGEYEFTAIFGGKPPQTVKNHIHPTFRRVIVPVPQ